jgi:hypothetical protein
MTPKSLPLLMALLAASSLWGQTTPPEYDSVMRTLGKQGDYRINVLKVNILRNDVKVNIDGISVPTPFGFGG